MLRTSFLGVAALPVDDQTVLVGLTDVVVFDDPVRPMLYATARGGGWLTSFDLGPEAGDGRLTDLWQIPSNYLQLESTDLLLRPDGAGVDLLLAGLVSGDLLGWSLSGTGFGAWQRYDAGTYSLRDISEIELVSDNLALASLRTGGLIQMTFSAGDRVSVGAPFGNSPQADASADALTVFDHQGTTYAVAALGATDALTLLRLNNGLFTYVQTLNIADGLWIDRPGALSAINVGAETYVILGSSGSSSLTVLEMDGSWLRPVSHILDDATMRFAQASFVQAFEVAGLPFVVAAGGDQGLSILALLPGGRLSHVTSVAATASLPLSGITAMDVLPTETGARIFVSAEATPHLIEYEFDLPNLGNQLTGGATGETLAGTALDDVISGQAGNDVLSGAGGSDILFDGPGADSMRGGAGQDLFIAVVDGSPDTILDFQRQTDAIELSSPELVPDLADVRIFSRPWGAELVLEGERLLVYSADGGSLSAGDFAGFLSVAPQIEIDPDAYPDPGPDRGDENGSALGPTQLPGRPPERPEQDREPVIAVTIANPRLGTPNADRIGTFRADDVVVALAGNDTVSTGAGNDIILGEIGFDTLMGSWGSDSISGGANADSLMGGPDDDLITGGTGFDHLLGEDGNDTLWGGKDPDRLKGGAGDDWIHAGSNFGTSVDGADGGDGNDTLLGGAGFDLLIGDAGDDQIDGGHQADNLYGSEGNDTLWGDLGFDRLFGGLGDDVLYGGDGTDAHFGDAGNDTMWGGENEDRFFGGSGDDLISGDNGNDTLRGNAGFDTLIGGNGNDQLWGDFNGDRFVFADGHGHDTVFDFETSNPTEVLDFSQLNTFGGTSDVFLMARQEGQDVLIATGNTSSIRLVQTDLADLDGMNFLF